MTKKEKKKMTKPIFKTRCERYLSEFRALEKKYDLSVGEGRLVDGFDDRALVLSTPKPISDGNRQWFHVIIDKKEDE